MEKIRTILVDDNQAYTYWGMDSRLIMHFEDFYIDIIIMLSIRILISTI